MIRGKDAVVAMPVLPWRRDEIGEPVEDASRVEEPLPHLGIRHPAFSTFFHLVTPVFHHHPGEHMSTATATTESTTSQNGMSATFEGALG